MAGEFQVIIVTTCKCMMNYCITLEMGSLLVHVHVQMYRILINPNL